MAGRRYDTNSSHLLCHKCAARFLPGLRRNRVAARGMSAFLRIGLELANARGKCPETQEARAGMRPPPALSIPGPGRFFCGGSRPSRKLHMVFYL